MKYLNVKNQFYVKLYFNVFMSCDNSSQKRNGTGFDFQPAEKIDK